MNVLHFLKSHSACSGRKTRQESSQAEALIKLAELQLGYVPWTSSAMTPNAVVHILNEIIINNRTRILELGMGLSTLYIAKLAKELEGVRLLSVDHDSCWINICRQNLLAKGLDMEGHAIGHLEKSHDHLIAP